MTKVFNMSAAIKLDECYDETSGGGNVDDILDRLGRVESTVSEIREQVSGIAATIPHLATKQTLTPCKATSVLSKSD